MFVECCVIVKDYAVFTKVIRKFKSKCTLIPMFFYVRMHPCRSRHLIKKSSFNRSIKIFWLLVIYAGASREPLSLPPNYSSIDGQINLASNNDVRLELLI
jgi:hypothetical protein